LDNQIDISLVHGNAYNKNFNDELVIAYPEWITKPPPSGRNYFLYWLATSTFFAESTYCVRSSVFKRCFPEIKNVEFDYYNPPDPMTDQYFDTHNPFLKFIYNFITSGFLPKYISSVASFGRWHRDGRNYKFELYIKETNKKYEDYISKLNDDFFSGDYVYRFRDANSKVIGKISKNKIFISKIRIIVYRIFNKWFVFLNQKNNHHHHIKKFVNKVSLKNIIKRNIIFRSARFIKHYYKFMKLNDNRFKLLFNNCLPILNEWSDNHGFDRHYVYHTSWAARIIANNPPQLHIDIASDLKFSSIISAFTRVDYYDYRKLDLHLEGLNIHFADILDLPFESNSIISISCMHVVEHIGLGRYGERIDPTGDLKSIKELIRVLAKGGKLFFVVPIGEKRIEFNAHRVYNSEDIISYFSDLKLLDFSLIPDSGKDGGLVKNPSESLLRKQITACGCFLFEK